MNMTYAEKVIFLDELIYAKMLAPIREREKGKKMINIDQVAQEVVDLFKVARALFPGMTREEFEALTVRTTERINKTIHENHLQRFNELRLKLTNDFKSCVIAAVDNYLKDYHKTILIKHKILILYEHETSLKSPDILYDYAENNLYGNYYSYVENSKIDPEILHNSKVFVFAHKKQDSKIDFSWVCNMAGINLLAAKEDVNNSFILKDLINYVPVVICTNSLDFLRTACELVNSFTVTVLPKLEDDIALMTIKKRINSNDVPSDKETSGSETIRKIRRLGISEEKVESIKKISESDSKNRDDNET
jgi:intracellular sulfur oxidation DsrE/DsrF family protein